jgi:nicotinate dehydrogenase subunit A
MRKPSDLVLQVNGKQHSVTVSPDASLLFVLRNDLALNAPKYGCGLGQCGACTVLINRVAARSCVIPVGELGQRSVTTLEGLAIGETLHPVQAAFIQEQAAQCGYCLNGMIMTVVALLERIPEPTESHITDALSGNICRCGTHVEIMAAARQSVKLLAQMEPRL